MDVCPVDRFQLSLTSEYLSRFYIAVTPTVPRTFRHVRNAHIPKEDHLEQLNDLASISLPCTPMPNRGTQKIYQYFLGFIVITIYHYTPLSLDLIIKAATLH